MVDHQWQHDYTGPCDLKIKVSYPQWLLEFYFQIFSSKRVRDPEHSSLYYTISYSCRAAENKPGTLCDR